MGCWALCLANLAVAAEPLHFESPVERASVVELFTSHGCSSCPPADAWLTRFRDDPVLWRQVIPLAFHVDYWDYLGWQDRFASPAYGQRQRAYRHSGGLGSVYTPGLLVNGKEWRGWYSGRPLPVFKSAPVGRLTLDIEPDRQAVLRFSPETDSPTADLQANLAILGGGLKSHIGAGENRGRDLDEEFVVLDYRTVSKPVSPNTWRIDWPAIGQPQEGQFAVAAWVSRGDDPEPLQATGGWLP